ncbi:MAG: PepSY-associated TM helix domain-containing protein [Pseudonocardiaceae bacterium]
MSNGANALRIKPALRWVHRWLALTFGVILALIGLTGSLLLFQTQFFSWAHGELIPANLSQEIGSLDRWVANAERAMPPQFHGPHIIYAPHVDHNLSDAGMVYYLNPEPGGFIKEGYAAALIEPATGDVLGTIDLDRSPAYAPLALHSALWSGETGEVLTAIVAVGALILLPLGLYLWWPSRSKLIRKLSPRPWRKTVTQAGRLHDFAGGWAVIVLLMLAATGVYMAQGEWVEPVLTATVGAEPGPPAEPAACAGPMGLDKALHLGQQLAPSGRWLLAEPLDDHEPRHWRFVFKTGESVRQKVSVLADMQCGAVSVESTPTTRPPRDTAELWLATLHDGTAFGLFGEILITVAGLVPLVLLWSGIRMWMRRRGWLAAGAPKGAP